MTTITPYPLCWPEGVARSRSRGSSPFRTAYAKAIDNVVRSLNGFQKDSNIKIEHPVLSSNMDLMGRLLNNDPGVAAWFRFDGQMVAFGVDRFSDPAANVQAIHHIIEARRTELRYGGLAIVKQTFRSFHAMLPSPSARHWSDVLGVPRSASAEEINAAYRKLAMDAHADRGGSDAKMSELNVARDAAMRDRA